MPKSNRDHWRLIHKTEVLLSLIILAGSAVATIVGYVQDFLPLALSVSGFVAIGYGITVLLYKLAKERQRANGLLHVSYLHKRERDENIRELEEKAKELEKRSEETAKCQEDYNRLQREFGRLRIHGCGIDGEYRNKSVKVQFVDLADRELAERAKELFSIAWHVRDIEQVQWKPNPSPDHRIIIFSNDEYASGVRSAINDHNLLGERVTKKGRDPSMEDDVTVVIFSEKGSGD